MLYEVITISLFEIESQRRTKQLEEINVAPAMEILFDSDILLKEKLVQLKDSIKSKKADSIRAFIEKDIEQLSNGIMLSNLDKYISIAYEKPATVLDYFDKSLICVCEYHNIAERLKGFYGQLNEDIKILFEEGVLFKGLDDFCLENGEFLYKLETNHAIFLDTFMHGTNMRFKKLINANPLQTSVWGGDLKILIEDLTAYCEKDYSTILMAGSEKTVPIIARDLTENNIPADIVTET